LVVRRSDRSERPRLLALTIGADREPWRQAGFAVTDDGVLLAGDVMVQLDASAGTGIVGWTLSTPVAGFPSCPQPKPATGAAEHPNGVIGVDHVVVSVLDLEAATAALVEAGCDVRGQRSAVIKGHNVIQRLLPLQNALIELVAPVAKSAYDHGTAPSFWGVTFVCPELSRLGPHVAVPRPAVQPGRQIATAGREAQLGTRVAFMTPRPR
jgi:hypothetical protein